MRTNIGDKVTTPMPDGLSWPAIVISRETPEVVTVINKSTGLPVDITVTRVDVLSQRTARDGTVYPAVTSEVVQYGYRPVAMPRFDNVVGLDIDEDGTLRTLDQNLAEHAKSYSEFAAKQFELRRGASAPADLRS